jgi:hypothetical protein
VFQYAILYEWGDVKTTGSKRNNILLVILILVFIAPGLFAYLFFAHPNWMPAALTNKGRLQTASQTLSFLPKSSHWHLLLSYPKACDKTCQQKLQALAKVRLALGRKLYQVTLCVLIPKRVEAEKAFLTELQEKDICLYRLPGNNLAMAPEIWLATPQRELLLRYAFMAPVKDVFQDIPRY